MNGQNTLLRLSMWIFSTCGVWLIGLGGYFMLVRPPLLPEDLRYLGSSAIQVEVLLPQLASWLRNVFNVMGGFMAGCGVLTIFMSTRAIPQHLPGTAATLCFAGVFTVVTMSVTNFVLDSDFKWLLLAPAVAWLLGFLCYVAGTRAEHVIAVVPQINDDVQK